MPDDRATVYAAREVIAAFMAHQREALGAERVAKMTGIERDRVEPVLRSLVKALVLDCDGDPALRPCTFDPDPVLMLEVERFLRAPDPDGTRMQSSIGRFRSRLGRG
jgi:hypothetical protein